MKKTAAEFIAEVCLKTWPTVSRPPVHLALLDMFIADIADIDAAERVADTYFALMDRLGTADRGIPAACVHDRWRRWRALAIPRRYLRCATVVCFDDVADGESGESSGKMRQWEHLQRLRVAQARQTLDDIRASGQKDLATLSVAARRIRRMTRTSGRGISGWHPGSKSPMKSALVWRIDMYQHVNHATMVRLKRHGSRFLGSFGPTSRQGC